MYCHLLFLQCKLYYFTSAICVQYVINVLFNFKKLFIHMYLNFISLMKIRDSFILFVCSACFCVWCHPCVCRLHHSHIFSTFRFFCLPKGSLHIKKFVPFFSHLSESEALLNFFILLHFVSKCLLYLFIFPLDLVICFCKECSTTPFNFILFLFLY